MYTRPQSSSAGKILLQPNQPPRTDPKKNTTPLSQNELTVSQNAPCVLQKEPSVLQNSGDLSPQNKGTPPQNKGTPPQNTGEETQSTGLNSVPAPSAAPEEKDKEQQGRASPRYKARRPEKNPQNKRPPSDYEGSDLGVPPAEAPFVDKAESTAKNHEKAPFHSTCSLPNDVFSPKSSPPKKGGLGALLEGYTSDELLVLTIIVLLIMQGSDDILVLALCYIII